MIEYILLPKFYPFYGADNLNGAKLLGRIVRVDHVSKYKKKEEEDEEEAKRKREERGVCRAFQRGECNRGDSCKFSHDEQVSLCIRRLKKYFHLVDVIAYCSTGLAEERKYGLGSS